MRGSVNPEIPNKLSVIIEILTNAELIADDLPEL